MFTSPVLKFKCYSLVSYLPNRHHRCTYLPLPSVLYFNYYPPSLSPTLTLLYCFWLQHLSAKMSRKGLMEQNLYKLDVTKLHPLSSEVISRQATFNIGHMAHGKSTIVKAISSVQGQIPIASMGSVVSSSATNATLATLRPLT